MEQNHDIKPLLQSLIDGPFDADAAESLRVCLNGLLFSDAAARERKNLRNLPNEKLSIMAKRYASTMADSQAADLLHVIAERLGK